MLSPLLIVVKTLSRTRPTSATGSAKVQVTENPSFLGQSAVQPFESQSAFQRNISLHTSLLSLLWIAFKRPKIIIILPYLLLHAGSLLGLFFNPEDSCCVSSETWVGFQSTTWHYSLEDRTLHNDHSDYLNSCVHKSSMVQDANKFINSYLIDIVTLEIFRPKCRLYGTRFIALSPATVPWNHGITVLRECRRKHGAREGKTHTDHVLKFCQFPLVVYCVRYRLHCLTSAVTPIQVNIGFCGVLLKWCINSLGCHTYLQILLVIRLILMTDIFVNFSMI
jgi:hypothetical protein